MERSPGNTDLRNSRALARVLDTAFRIPGTNIRLGLDSIIGLIPGGGDAVGALLSSYIILSAARQGAPRSVLLRMVGNVAIDSAIGAIPILGDIFDIAFKSNARNAALLEQVTVQPAAAAKSSRRVGILLVSGLLLVLFALAVLGFFVARLLWRALTGS
ncbi:MAG TPA: DUF4112 domain-containing protein [Gemmatimonadaceae bacterium]|nr:DUF4112 domain-containing protein [Gemmatimonadaceae bacterium]